MGFYFDPKCDWALRHLELFPIEINRADYAMLLRVPGIGVKSARRIVAARRTAILDFDDLKKIGVVLKRAVFFITCNGRNRYPIKYTEEFIGSNLIDRKEAYQYSDGMVYRQLNLFQDV